MLLIAHLSDIHVGRPRAVERTERVMRYLHGLRRAPDVVLVTGDLAQHGAETEYQQVRDALSSPLPVLLCPGNHDDRPAYRQVLLGEGAAGSPINSAHTVAGAVFAMCDSTIPGRNEGVLADETLDWLADLLGRTGPDVPVFVCFHHPPVVLHHELLDSIRQSGEDRLATLAARHPNLAAFLCGHGHTAAAAEFAGRPLRVAPGVVSTLWLEWETADALEDTDAPPGVAFHVYDQGRLVTHYRVVY
jgi:3',5'-cyclic AMP phosphodiesterase CpdA